VSHERRNHYRILHVQPEAPPEVIKSSWRALMSRLHPDRGGDHEHAALLNAAYAVLSDPEQRRRYDQTLRRPARGATAVFDATDWLSARVCPFCRHAFAGAAAPGLRCSACDSPLGPPPAVPQAGSELIGRRRGERFARDVDSRLRLPAEAGERLVRLRDLSLTGLALVSAARIPIGTPLRLTADTFDTVAITVACRAALPVFTVHARLLTLQLLRSGRGVYVNARA